MESTAYSNMDEQVDDGGITDRTPLVSSRDDIDRAPTVVNWPERSKSYIPQRCNFVMSPRSYFVLIWNTIAIRIILLSNFWIPWQFAFTNTAAEMKMVDLVDHALTLF